MSRGIAVRAGVVVLGIGAVVLGMGAVGLSTGAVSLGTGAVGLGVRVVGRGVGTAVRDVAPEILDAGAMAQGLGAVLPDGDLALARGGPLAVVVPLAQVLLAAALVLAFSRLVRGPHLADRVVALDLTALIVVGLIAIYVIQTGEATLLDAAIVLALIGFLSTVAFARYLERRTRR